MGHCLIRDRVKGQNPKGSFVSFSAISLPKPPIVPKACAMVDRIVPATTDADRAVIEGLLGLRDGLAGNGMRCQFWGQRLPSH
jgi:hypothetical protein